MIIACGILVWRTFGTTPAANHSAQRMFIDSETGKPFEYTVKPGDTVPIPSPFTNRRTGYPAEACYWTAEGQKKDTPTYVLLNSYKGSSEPTFCPDCGRLVIGHNPRPQPGAKPPPTPPEYTASPRANKPRDF